METLSERTKKNIYEILTEQLKTNDFTIEISPGSNIGDNYLGVVYRVKAVVNKNKQRNDKREELSIIVKIPPTNKFRREQFFARHAFLREILTYSEILPIFQKFQLNKDKKLENGFHEYPICYQNSIIEFDESLFFEDLKISGFKMYNRHIEASYLHSKLIMETLGKLHAVSYAIKDQEPELLNPYRDMIDMLVSRQNNEPLSQFFVKITERALETLDPEEDKELLIKLRKFLCRPYLEILGDFLDGNRSEPLSVITHGDCWINNILFKLDEVSLNFNQLIKLIPIFTSQNNKPEEIRFLDWQVCRYASPVTDILYFLFGCTSTEFRSEHYETLLNDYYNSLSNSIKRLGTDPELIIPYKTYKEEIQKFGNFAFLISMMTLPFFSSHIEDNPDFDYLSEKACKGQTQDINWSSIKSNEIYKERMLGVFKDCEKFGYI